MLLVASSIISVTWGFVNQLIDIGHDFFFLFSMSSDFGL